MRQGCQLSGGKELQPTHAPPNRELKKSETCDSVIKEWIADTIQQEKLLVFMVDDYTNVHTKHRPKDLNPNQISKKATLLLKRFDHAAIPVTNLPESNNPVGVDPTLLEYFVKDHLSSLMKTYAQVMPNWIRAKFFDPKCERKRLMAHNYQEQEQIRVMRSMVDYQLIDCIELPLKSFDNFYTAIQHALQLGLSEYLEKFLVINPGDWPAQFYIRQIVYNPPPNAEYFLKNIISMIGALHVSLNGRENPVLQFIIFFKKLYLGVFGQNRKPLQTSHNHGK